MPNIRRWVSAIVIGGSLSAPAGAAYLNVTDYKHAIGGAKNQQVAMPAQQLTFADRYGSFTAATWRDAVYVPRYPVGYEHHAAYLGSENREGFATRDGVFRSETFTEVLTGQGGLIGRYGCHSAYIGCLGIDTITYKLPFAIQAISGNLFAANSYGYDLLRQSPYGGGHIDFFEFNEHASAILATQPPIYRRPTGEIFPPGAYYEGFWGRTFDSPTDTLTIAWGPMDAYARFELTNALVVPAREGNNGHGPVPVPAPAGFGLLLVGLLGLALVRPGPPLITPAGCPPRA
jgi:hypothetical protein